MVSSGFTRLETYHCYYSKWFENSYSMLLLYVYDMLIVGSIMNEIVNLKTRLAKDFSIKDLGPTRKILEMRISRERKEVVLNIAGRVRKEDVEEV